MGTLDPCRSSRVIRSMVVRACWTLAACELRRGWLLTPTVIAVTAAPITIRPITVAMRSSGSVKPPLSLAIARLASIPAPSAPGVGRRPARGAAVEEPADDVVGCCPGQDVALREAVGEDPGVRVHVQRLACQRAAVLRVAVHLDVGQGRVDDEVLHARAGDLGVAAHQQVGEPALRADEVDCDGRW